MTEIFKTAAETSGCRMIAVQDDVYFLGTPACAATAWDALKTLTTHNTGLELNGEKTSILLPDESSTRLFLERKLTPSTTFIPALGSIVTREMSVLSRWLVAEMRRSHGKLFRTITDKRMPSQTGFLLLRMCAVPLVQYWIRTSPPTASAELAEAFDDEIMQAARAIMNLPVLSDLAQKQIVLPVTAGGFGLRSMKMITTSSW